MISETIGIKNYSFKNRSAKTLTDLNNFDTKPSILRAKSKVEIRKVITRKLGNSVCEFITNHLHGFRLQEVLLFDSFYKDEILSQPKKVFNSIVNLSDVNDYRRINKFFETINSKLPDEGVFINSFVPYDIRKKKFLERFPKPLSRVLYLGDFIFHRILPKLKLTKKLYFRMTKGRSRVLTKTEVFGRLYSCGFDLLEEKIIDNKLYFVAKKIGTPSYDPSPTYGPLISLKRVGKNGKRINVYKLRTMHPYSEYLQKYIFERNNLRKGGKINNDFRISNVGRLFRKYWIDELPMILNLFKGDLKLVGGRPLSEHYFSLYSQELREKRIKFKPGLIPPFYADMPETLEGIMESEMRYLEAYEKQPLKTDIIYLSKIFGNILFKGKRSL